jgi:hypothetical protein
METETRTFMMMGPATKAMTTTGPPPLRCRIARPERATFWGWGSFRADYEFRPVVARQTSVSAAVDAERRPAVLLHSENYGRRPAWCVRGA